MGLLAALGVFAVSIFSTDVEIAFDSIKSSQALFIAETGRQFVMYKLKTDNAYRTSGYATPQTGSIGDGAFSVSVTKAGNVYTLTSAGTVGVVTRKVRQEVSVTGGGRPPFLDYAVFFGGGDGTIWTSIYRDANITGDIFINGDMDMGRDSTIDGSVIATGQIELGANVTITGSTTPYAAPPAAQPAFDTTYYDNEIATAALQPAGNQNISGAISGTTYVNGNVIINGDLTGSGAIVTTGDITIRKDRVVGNGITLISGDVFTAAGNVSIGSNCTVYASSQLTMGSNNNVGSSGSNNGSVLLSDGGIDILGSSTLYGFVFGDGEVNLTASVTLTGNLSGSEMGEIRRYANITLDANSVDFSLIHGFATDFTVTPQSWNEIN